MLVTRNYIFDQKKWVNRNQCLGKFKIGIVVRKSKFSVENRNFWSKIEIFRRRWKEILVKDKIFG